MSSRANKPHFVRSKQKPVVKTNILGLIAMTLSRTSKQNMKKHFQQIKQYGQKNEKTISRMMKICSKNIFQTKLLAWKQLRYRVILQRKNQKHIRKVSALALKFQNHLMRTAFIKLTLLSKSIDQKMSHKFIQSRMAIFTNALNKFIKNKLKTGIINIRKQAKLQQQKVKHVKSLKYLWDKLKIKKTQICWKMLLNINYSGNNNFELKQLKDKLNKVQKQLEQKNKRCEELEKMQEQDNQFDKKSKDNKKRSLSQTSIKRNKSIEKQDKKSDFGNISVGSVLNNSFFTWRSGKSSRQDSANGGGQQCYCKYRQRYNHYKCQALSLKNQLQIIKKELEVTKDLNEHLQNEFTQCFVVEDSVETQRLKKENKELKKERQALRQKITKYQKYISNLKYEFKIKMENLYRNIKKNS